MSRQERGEVQGVCTTTTTKDKIALSLRRMMMERPFQKITVQNLMDDSGMKRQSFYYHFEDTRDVLRWICKQELCLPLADCELPLEGWLLYAMELLDRERGFYRRVLSAGDAGFLAAQGEQLLAPRVAQLYYGTRDLTRLDEGQRFAVSFSVRALNAHALEFIHSRQNYDPAAARRNLRCLISTLHLDE